MKIVMLPPKSLKPYARNARINDSAVDAVAASITAFGFRQPIVVDAKKVIIAGHTRHKAALKLGLATVPVHIAEGLTVDQVKAYRLADNKVGELAEWDEAKLLAELKELAASGCDVTMTGFSEADLAALVPAAQSNDDEPEESELPSLEMTTTHMISIRYSEEDMIYIKKFLKCPNDDMLHPIRTGGRILERIKAVVDGEVHHE